MSHETPPSLERKVLGFFAECGAWRPGRASQWRAPIDGKDPHFWAVGGCWCVPILWKRGGATCCVGTEGRCWKKINPCGEEGGTLAYIMKAWFMYIDDCATPSALQVTVLGSARKRTAYAPSASAGPSSSESEPPSASSAAAGDGPTASGSASSCGWSDTDSTVKKHDAVSWSCNRA